MKIRYLQLLVCIIMTLGSSGCSYFHNRLRDAGDIITITGGIGLGVSAQAGPIIAGFAGIKDVGGIQNGTPFIDGISMEKDPNVMQLTTTILNVKDFYSLDHEHSNDARERNKQISAFGIGPTLINGAMAHHDVNSSWTYYSQLEVAVAIGPSVRVGINPGEFIDFILGIFGLDIASDDKK